MPEQKLEKILKNAGLGIIGALIAVNVYSANVLYVKELEYFKNPNAISLYISLVSAFAPFLLANKDEYS